MALAISYILVAIGIAMLLIYYADTQVGGGAGGDGFIPLDSMARGIGFGTPPIILAVAAYFISRKEPSMPLGGLITAIGLMIVVGGVMSVSAAEPESGMSSGGGLLAVGAAILALGIFKIIRSR